MSELQPPVRLDIDSWREAYELHMVSLQEEVPSTAAANLNFEALALGRAFHPKPYITSSIQHVIALPWATEYFILPY
jgi:hypothetical protein